MTTRAQSNDELSGATPAQAYAIRQDDDGMLCFPFNELTSSAPLLTAGRKILCAAMGARDWGEARWGNSSRIDYDRVDGV